MRLVLAVLVAVAAFPVLAQDTRLVIREASRLDVDPGDSTGWHDPSEPDRTGEALALGPVLLGLGPGTVRAVGVVAESFSGRFNLELVFAEPAAERFAEITEAAVGQLVAFVLDGRVLAAPRVVERIASGRVQIAGALSCGAVSETAAVIREVTGAASANAEVECSEGKE